MTVNELTEFLRLSQTGYTPQNIWLFDNKSWLRCVHRISDATMALIKDEEVITAEMFDGQIFITVEKSLDELRTGQTT